MASLVSVVGLEPTSPYAPEAEIGEATKPMSCPSMRSRAAELVTASRLLWFFTAVNCLIYYDRGLIAGFLPAIEEEFNDLDKTLSGLLGSGFIGGFTLGTVT